LKKIPKKGQRIGRNPKTGAEAPVSPCVVVFEPSAILKQRINEHSPGNGACQDPAKNS
jgi:integration host factor subunit alpha